MQIKIVTGVVVGQQPRKPGDVVECPDGDAKGLIATGQAIAFDGKQPKKESAGK
jgi:hypothetical protein